MNYSYKKMYNKNYLVLGEFDSPLLTNDYQFEMLKRNSIGGLMDMQLFMDDNVPFFQYDITGKLSFHSRFYNDTIKKEHIITFLTNLHNTILNLNKYLLDYNHLILIPQCIFCDKDLEHYYFVYCPNHTSDFFVELKNFISYLLTITDHNDEQTVLIAYSLWQEVQNENFNLKSLLTVIEKYPLNTSQPFISNRKPEPTVEPQMNLDDSNNILKNPDILLKENYRYSSSFIIKNVIIFSIVIIIFLANFIMKIFSFYSTETFFVILIAIISFSIFYASTILRDAPLHRIYNKTDDIEPEKIIHINTSINIPDDNSSTETFSATNSDSETVLLCVNPIFQDKHLIYTGLDFSQEVTLNNFPFIIGKNDANNLVIDNPVISRTHARIFMENDLYYIEDLNSSNGTKVNDQALASYTPTEINIGDTITFAHLTYIFQ